MNMSVCSVIKDSRTAIFIYIFYSPSMHAHKPVHKVMMHTYWHIDTRIHTNTCNKSFLLALAWRDIIFKSSLRICRCEISQHGVRLLKQYFVILIFWHYHFCILLVFLLTGFCY